jgi:WD40 repeat protein
MAGGEPGKRGAAVLYDVRTGATLATLGDERDVPLAAAVHRGAGLVALGGSGKCARVHRIADGTELLAGKHEDFVLALAFAPDGKWLAAGDRTGNVSVWETKDGRVFQTLLGHQGAVHTVAFDRSGKSLLTAGADGTVRLWDVEQAKERWRQNAHPNQQALAACFGPGDAIASCGSDGVVQVFTTAGAAKAKSAATGEWLYAVAFGADDNVVFAGDWQGRVHRLDVASRQLTATVPLATAR